MPKRLLSELILEGAKKRPQGFGDYFVKNKKGEVYSCALGAAYEAIEGDDSYDNTNRADDRLKDLIPSDQLNLIKKIADLNDKLSLTREEIATRLVSENLDVMIEY